MTSQEPFQPFVREWFAARYGAPTEVQSAAWPHIDAGRSLLALAPTGSGKTLTGFLGAISKLLARGPSSGPAKTTVVYLSPLKALSSDIEKNLQSPLAELHALAGERGIPTRPITIGVRTGDTPNRQRQSQLRSPPDILVTTPESLYLLLTSDGGRRMLATTETIIVDEIHAVLEDKRGAHLALSLARLEALVERESGHGLQRIGLSATQKPIEVVARFLARHTDGTPAPVEIVDRGHRRALDLKLEVPGSPLSAVLSSETWSEVYARLAELVREHRTTIVFTNTRRQAERITRHLGLLLGKDEVASHHGSLAKELRLDAEERLKTGKLRVLVATGSMELGIDVGDVDLVCQIGSPRSIAALLQRVGRSGHSVGGTPKGRLFPLSRNDLVECVALLDAVRRGELDSLRERPGPLDILAQQLVAELSAQSHSEEDLFRLVRSAAPYSSLPRAKFDEVVRMLASGFVTERGLRGALVHHDRVGGVLHGRRGARLAALLSGGAIPENFEYEVLLAPENLRIGSLNEDFAIESSVGDVFQLGNRSYQISKLTPGTLFVVDAPGALPNLPFWLGEAKARTDELSSAVSRLRSLRNESEGALVRHVAPLGLPEAALAQLLEYLGAAHDSLGLVPTQSALVAERFFDETGGMHVVVHSPYGVRHNRAFGFALRKRFCRSFNVELQAAADDDALLLSLGPTHSFPLEELPKFLRSGSASGTLEQAILDAPIFATRFRQNATRALSVLRFRGGKKVAPRFQRMEADDLLALCFPDQVACLENVSGDRRIPEHPLVEQTLDDCLFDALDQPSLLRMLKDIENGAISFVCREGTAPSPLAAEILNSRPYAFLDDAPLEERRSHAVRRPAHPSAALDVTLIDVEAVTRVVRENAPDPRNTEELYDALVVHGFLTTEELRAAGAEALANELFEQGRAGCVDSGETRLWFSFERASEILELFERSPRERFRTAPPRFSKAEDALPSLLRGRLSLLGPTTVAEIADCLRLPATSVESALVRLEAEGFALRGDFRRFGREEFCERRILRRIYALSHQTRRREYSPLSPAEYGRFLLAYQGLSKRSRRQGSSGLTRTLDQLSGFGAPLELWLRDLLPARQTAFVPVELDALGWSGDFTWGAFGRRGKGPFSSVPITFCRREDSALWLGDLPGRAPLGADESRIEKILTKGGAPFVADIVREARLLPSAAEEALKGLVTRGLVTFDSVGAAASLFERRRRPRVRDGRPSADRPRARGRLEWLGARPLPEDETAREEAMTRRAWTYLRRYGVVTRTLLERELEVPPFRELLRVLHRLEARGEVRGGRFIAGLGGEQFALPEVAETLRTFRDAPTEGEEVILAAQDPACLLGILFAGERPRPGTRVLHRDGVPLGLVDGRRQPPSRATRA